MSRLVILVDLYWTRDKDPRVPLGHASLLTALRTHAPEARVAPLVEPVNLARLDIAELAEQILALALGYTPEEVDLALGAYVWAESIIQLLLPTLRQRGFMGRIILGGPQISYAADGLEQLYPDADVFVRGYGEDALAALARAPQARDIPGVHHARTADRRAQTTVDLEQLPSPWLSGAIPLADQRFVRWETQRGCPFRCAFCQHREPGERLRRRGLHEARVMEELELFCRSGVEQIAVLDPIFNASPTSSAILRAFVDRGFTGNLELQCRAESIRPDFVEAAARLDVTLEFGLQTTHDGEGRAIDRRNDLRRVDAALQAVRDHDIHHEVSLIFGLPTQTLASFKESVQWCLDRQVPIIKAFPLMLLRGTPLERDRARWGLVERPGELPVVIQSDSFDTQEWAQMDAISQALRMTEGQHPADLPALLAIAADLSPDMDRWTPS